MEPPRLSLLIAKEAPVAVIIARVRAKLFHVMKWQYEDGIVDHGSWFKGNFYPDSSDISFDGRYMVYFALNPKSGAFSWTGVCEPPLVKAIAFWEHDSTWYGGGFFPDPRTLWLYMPSIVQPGWNMWEARSKAFKKTYRFRYPDDITTEMVPFVHKMVRDGWRLMENTSRRPVLERRSPDGCHSLLLLRDNPENPRESQYCLCDVNGAVTDQRTSTGSQIIDRSVTWADWEPDGHLLVASGGIISRVHLEHPDKPIVLLDLSNLTVPDGEL